jgi:hypothetical protein
MGHIRLTRIPKTKRWSGVFHLFESKGIDTVELSKAIAESARKNYSSLEENDAINYWFWILVRIASASRGNDFTTNLESLGININNVTSGISFIQNVSSVVEKETIKRSRRTVFVEMAELSLREVLTKSIVEESKSLFGTSIYDIQNACRKISTNKRFGELSREYFAKFMCRTIQYITDKEISNYVGQNNPINDSIQILDFQHDLSRYCYEAAKIVEDFSSGWFSKNNWESNNNISEQSTRSFTKYALSKIQMELQKGIS